MEERLIRPTKDTIHPATAIMLKYLNEQVGMKKLFEWKVFFKKRADKNKLASTLLSAAEKIIEGGTVEEVDFVALMWMILKFNKDDDLIREKQWIEREKRKAGLK